MNTELRNSTCPNCGRPLADTGPATVVNARVTVDQNRGDVRAIEAQVVQGDLLANVYQAEVYVLTEAGRSAGWHRFLEHDAAPYKLLAPYTAKDHVLFKGRDEEIGQILRRLAEHPLLVVYGQPGVGKTSLLAAGVAPALVERGALIVHIHEYHDPARVIREALAASAEKLRIPLPEDATLPALVRSVVDSTQGSLIIICDQFEALFDPAVDADHRQALLNSIGESLQAADPRLLRWIFVTREDALGALAAYHTALPDALRSPVKIGLLSRQQAIRAVEEPLRELDYPVSFVGGLVESQLVPDLDELTPNLPGVQPAHLQIVCHWLFQAASNQEPPHIDADLYAAAKGADGIMAGFLEQALQTEFAGDRSVAERILGEMAQPRGETWVALDRLALGDVPPQRAREIAEELCGAGLLIKRSNGQRSEYSVASTALLEELRHLRGAAGQRLLQVEDELERAWSTWLVREGLPTRGQLHFLETGAGRLNPPPIKVLLLLQAAVARGTPVDPWLTCLRTPEGRALIRQLEDSDRADPDLHGSRSAIDKASMLLGLRETRRPQSIETGPRGFGPVAWAAVCHSDQVVRQTAALALTVVDEYEAIDRLNWALRAGPAGRVRQQRRAEIWGTLLDAIPGIGKLAIDFTTMERGLIWWDRVRRRLRQDQERIIALTVGGALGAGLAVGLLRGIIGFPTFEGFSRNLSLYFYFATILGGALSLGVALAPALLLTQPVARTGRSAESRPQTRPAGPVGLLTVGLAGLAFGLAHALMALLSGWEPVEAPLIAPLGFGAGIALGVALAGRPAFGQPIRAASWLWRLSSVAVWFAVVQGLFIVARDQGTGLSLVWNSGDQRRYFSSLLVTHFNSVANEPWVFDVMALLDASLVGVALAVGATLGLKIATEQLNRFRAMTARFGD